MVPTCYCTVNTHDGLITAAGCTDPESGDVTVPVGATIITAEQYATVQAELADGRQCRMVNGLLRLASLPTPAAPSLAAIKDAAAIQVDTAAEEARLRFLTPGSGQAMEYQETAAEAKRAQAATGPLLPADYPLLQAEVDALAAVGIEATLEAVATQVVTLMADWTTAAAAIKRIRRTAKLAIAAATDAAYVHQVVAELNWPNP